MPLRSPELVGMTDPRDLTGPPPSARTHSPIPPPAERDALAAAARAPQPTAPRERPRGGASSPMPDAAAAVRGRSTHAPPRTDPGSATPLDAMPLPPDQERAFVQILVAPELAVRIGRASHHLKLEIYKARFQQTIMGALIDQSIPDPRDPAVVAAMAALIARWRQDPLSERRASRRLGWHLPLELSMRLDELLLNLREQHYRLRPSATALLSAMIWFELDPDTPGGQQALRELVTPYHDRWEQTAYEGIAA